MKNYQLKIGKEDFEYLHSLLLADMPKEAGAFALAGIVEAANTVNVLVRRIVAVPSELFNVQQELRLEVASRAINGLIALCESNHLGAVICHSHPHESPYSSSDDYGEKRIVDAVRQFIPKNAPTVSLLISPTGIRGRIWLPELDKPVPLDKIVVIGRCLQEIELRGKQKVHVNTDVFDRQIRAFGLEGQETISRTKVGIVGIGGTGSAVAEQLVRLGTRDLLLIDPDRFGASNVTRVYGSDSGSNSRVWSWFKRREPAKVDVVAKHLRRIQPQLQLRTIPMSIVVSHVVQSLADRDVVFLCTDEHWGRSVVNQLAYQYYIPTINLGVGIRSDGDGVSGLGVVDLLRPGQPCLWCKQFLNSGRIAAESTPEGIRHQLQQEGYVEGIDTPAPSVISMTTTVASLGVSLYLQLLTDFMGKKGEISRLNYYVADSVVRRGRSLISPTCICNEVRGYGALKSLPTVADLKFLE